MEFQKVTISPDAIDPDDPGMLEDLVLAALRDAARRVGELQQQSLGGLGPMGGQLGGLLGGLLDRDKDGSVMDDLAGMIASRGR
jgi:hypothetical protein